jgi:hypothetical protein
LYFLHIEQITYCISCKYYNIMIMLVSVYPEWRDVRHDLKVFEEL